MKLDTSKTLLGLLSDDQSEDSWRIFVAVYRPFILKSISLRQVPAVDADDLCQETLIQVFKGIQGFEHNGRPGAFRSWLKTIVSQKVWGYFQAADRSAATRQAAQESARNSSIQFENETDLLWEREHDRHVVEKMLDLVKSEFAPSSWQSFRLVVLEGESPSRAAEQLGMSSNAVLIAKSRIMRRLRQLGEGLVTVLDEPQPGELM